MKYASTRRATIIALLFIFSPVMFANEKQVDLVGSNLIEINRSSSSGGGGLSVNPVIGKGSVVSSRHFDANQNKDKLTVFFAIGLVINLSLISLFAIWAVRQWRKMGKRGHANQ